MHHTGIIPACCIFPDCQTIHAKNTSKKIRICSRYISNCINPILGQFCCCSPSYIQQIRGRERPYLLLKILFRDFRNRIRLFHIASQLRKNLIVRNADGYGQPQFLFHRSPDILRSFHPITTDTLTACNIKPALVHPIRFYLICISLVNGTG